VKISVSYKTITVKLSLRLFEKAKDMCLTKREDLLKG